MSSSRQTGNSVPCVRPSPCTKPIKNALAFEGIFSSLYNSSREFRNSLGGEALLFWRDFPPHATPGKVRGRCPKRDWRKNEWSAHRSCDCGSGAGALAGVANLAGTEEE